SRRHLLRGRRVAGAHGFARVAGGRCRPSAQGGLGGGAGGARGGAAARVGEGELPNRAWGTELLPTKATFAPDEPVEVEARGGPATLELWHLDRKVGEAVADPVASFGVLPVGGY